MFDALERIRNKPSGERQVIALSVAGLITGIILVIWAISFFSTLKSREDGVSKNDSSTFGTFVDSFQEASSIIDKEIGATREQLEFIGGEFQKIESVVGEGIEENAEDLNSLINTSGDSEEDVEVTPSGIEIIQIEQ